MGLLSELNIFKTITTTSDMIKMTSSKHCLPPGDYLAWKDMKWNLDERANLIDFDKKEICAPEQKVIIPSFHFIYSDDCMEHCMKTH